MRIALTQGEGRLEGLVERLTDRGHQVARTPLVRSRPCLDDATRAGAAALQECPWLLFPSRSAVEAWTALGLPLSEGPGAPALGAVGDGTADALARGGGRVAVRGDPPTGAGLARAFLALPGARGPVGLPCGNRARAALPDALRAAGLEVRTQVVYRTETARWGGPASCDVVVLASPSAVRALPAAVAASAHLLAIGPTTAAALREAGFAPIVAGRPDVDGLLEEIDAIARAGGAPGDASPAPASQHERTS